MDFKLLAIVAVVCAVNQLVGARVASSQHDLGSAPPPAPMEELIKGAANKPDESSLFFDGKELMVKTEYDIVYSLQQWADLHKERQKRTAAIKDSHSNRWTKNVVNYEVAKSQMSSGDMSAIENAIDDLERYSCVKFVETTTAENRLRLQDAQGCYSRLGMVGGVQVVGLARGCRYKRIVMHELSHALGIHHEQTRPDRDDYVTIQFDNIDADLAYNFQGYDWKVMMDVSHPYDYESIMHYSDKAFSINGKRTIVTKDPEYQSKIGTYQELSFGDIKTINVMYQCEKTTDGCTLTHEDCEKEGKLAFVGKDCKCWCPGNPVRDCSEEESTCVDNEDSCSFWSILGYCSTYKSYMEKNCAKSCNAC